MQLEAPLWCVPASAFLTCTCVSPPWQSLAEVRKWVWTIAGYRRLRPSRLLTYAITLTVAATGFAYVQPTYKIVP